MAWESRGGSRYYYTSRRCGGKVAKFYHGKGAFGEAAAGMVAEARRKRADRAAALADERARLAPALRAMDSLDEACRLMVEATMVLGGYHRHDYHWRRRRARVEDRGLAEPAGRGRDPGAAGAGAGR